MLVWRVYACFRGAGVKQSVLGRDWKVSRSPKCPRRLWCSPAFCSVGTGGLYPLGKRLRREAGHSSEVRNEWSLPVLPPVFLWRAREQLLYLYFGCISRTHYFIQVKFLLPSLFPAISGLNFCGHYTALKMLLLCILVFDLSIVLHGETFEHTDGFYCGGLTLAVNGRRWQVYGLGLYASKCRDLCKFSYCLFPSKFCSVMVYRKYK
jgi:hypothetical protein